MKIGDTITVVGPHETLVTGTVVGVVPMKTRSGWYVDLRHDNGDMPDRYILRPDDEGRTWIHDADDAAKDALVVTRALAAHTVVGTRRFLNRNEPSKRYKK